MGGVSFEIHEKLKSENMRLRAALRQLHHISRLLEARR